MVIRVSRCVEMRKSMKRVTFLIDCSWKFSTLVFFHIHLEKCILEISNAPSSRPLKMSLLGLLLQHTSCFRFYNRKQDWKEEIYNPKKKPRNYSTCLTVSTSVLSVLLEEWVPFLSLRSYAFSSSASSTMMAIRLSYKWVAGPTPRYPECLLFLEPAMEPLCFLMLQLASSSPMAMLSTLMVKHTFSCWLGYKVE